MLYGNTFVCVLTTCITPLQSLLHFITYCNQVDSEEQEDIESLDVLCNVYGELAYLHVNYDTLSQKLCTQKNNRSCVLPCNFFL